MRQRIQEEKEAVCLMISLYCRKKEGNPTLCPKCQALTEYAVRRLDRCRFGQNKPTCQKCPIHCYRPDMKAQIKAVMRWSGPRMLLYHPIHAIRHMINNFHRLKEQ